MALAVSKTYAQGEVLTSSDLNSSFLTIHQNAITLISPLTASLDCDGNEFVLDSDADTSITADTDDRIDFRLGGVDLFLFDGTAVSLVNGITFTGAATGSGASVASTGSDTNIPVTLKGKGTGRVIIGQATSTAVQLAADQPIADSSGNELVKFSKAASAVNEVTLANAATGGAPVVRASGETNVSLQIEPKGTGTVLMTDGTDTTKKVSIALSGITTGTTRTLTMPDTNHTLFAAGTRMLFQQTAAPTGWTKETNATYNDAALRFQTGTVTTGGADAFSTHFGTGKSTAGFTLTTAEMPAHNHTYDHVPDDAGAWAGWSGGDGLVAANKPSSSTGGGGSHSHTLNSFDIKFADCIIAAKD